MTMTPRPPLASRATARGVGCGCKLSTTRTGKVTMENRADDNKEKGDDNNNNADDATPAPALRLGATAYKVDCGCSFFVSFALFLFQSFVSCFVFPRSHLFFFLLFPICCMYS
jgi:hypothetical protein